MAAQQKKAVPPVTAAPPMSSADIVAAIQSGNLGAFGGAAVEERAPLGGPEELLPPGSTPWLRGDEWEPQAYSPDVQALLKAQMASAGLYSNGYRAGGWDRSDANALEQVLEFANGKGITKVDEAVREFASFAHVYGPSAAKPKAPLVVQYANPESVRQVIRKSSMDLLGQRLSDDEESRLVAGFQSQAQRAAQGQVAARNAEGGDMASYTSELAPDEYAEQQLANRPEAGRQRYLEAFNAIHQSLTSTVTEAPRFTEGGGVTV